MTQEQKANFFERVNMKPFPVSGEDIYEARDIYYGEMFLALVEEWLFLEKHLSKYADELNSVDYLIFCLRQDAIIKIIKSASGLLWSEVREIYKECLG